MSQEQGLDGPAPAAPWSSPDAGGFGERDAGGSATGPVPAPATAPGSVPAPEQPDVRARYDAVPLRPLGIGDLLDGTFNTIRRNPRATVGLAAVLVTVQQLLSVGVQLVTDGLPTVGGNADDLFSFQAIGGFGGVIGALLAAVVGAVLTGMLVVVISDDVLGRRVSATDVWRRIRPRLWALLVAAAVAGIGPFLPLLVAAVAAFVAGGLALPLIVPALILWAAWALTTPALILEGLGPFAALRRSWQLAWPTLVRVWWVRALSVILALLMQVLIVVPFELAGELVARATGGGDEAGTAVTLVVLVLTVLGAIAGGTITAPFLAGVLALLYIDRRMRAEGLDLVLRRQLRTAAGRRTAMAPGAAPGGGP